MARKLVVAWLAVLSLGIPATAQETPPESTTIDISESVTDPIWTEECGTEVVVTITEDLTVTVCPTHPAPANPSQPVTGPAPLPTWPAPLPTGPAPLPTGPTPPRRLLSPFPIVRLVGSVTGVGTRIRLLEVRAPTGATAQVRCRGRGCPVRHAEKLIRRAPVRFAAFERLMPAQVVLEVLVHRGDSIGKYTRFKLRRDRRPKRVDGCLWPGTTRMAPCPET
jgi:hypothetical protein